jgi:hypothetical protein
VITKLKKMMEASVAGKVVNKEASVAGKVVNKGASVAGTADKMAVKETKVNDFVIFHENDKPYLGRVKCVEFDIEYTVTVELAEEIAVNMCGVFRPKTKEKLMQIKVACILGVAGVVETGRTRHMLWKVANWNAVVNAFLSNV